MRRLRRTNGLCERCAERGRTAEATRVDHILPLAMGGSDEDSNTRNLCEPCHLEVTSEQFGHAAPRAPRGVDGEGRPTNRDHPWAGAAPATGRQRRLPTPPGGSKVDVPPLPDTGGQLRALCEHFPSKKIGGG